ncbi:MAG TPA: helix-turn-helix transcriptional regulator [Pseudonocardiaceae bacterium]|nr:helix-turn-helix transcriptional regulator [Pseudonocardiaceae bacterium]
MRQPPPPANLAALGVEIARARLAAGLTLDGLAERSGVSRRMLIEIEQGRANPTVRILHAIAHGADASMCQLVLAACTDHPPAN